MPLLRGRFLFFWIALYNSPMSIIFWKNKNAALSVGAFGEKLAADYLKKKGYKIIEANFKNILGRRLGEIDIIAETGKTLVFVEVKTRTLENTEGPLPEESITPQKLRKLNKTSQFYIKLNNLWGSPFRFDAISIWISANRKNAKIKHIESIFY